MHFKKLICALSLASCGYAFADQVAEEREQDIACIVQVFDKALDAELAYIDSQVSEDMDLADVDATLQEKLGDIKTKFTRAFKNELTPEQQSLVVEVLKNLKALSVTTLDDLMLMAKVQTCDVDEAALKKYAPEIWRKMEMTPSREMTDANRRALHKELEKVDFGNVAANTLTRFMCKMSYLEEDLDAMVNVNCGNRQLLLQKCLDFVVDEIACLFIVFNDSCFFPGWQKEFKQSAKMLSMVHNVSTQLLEEIEA